MTAESLPYIGMAVTLGGVIWKLATLTSPIKRIESVLERLESKLEDVRLDVAEMKGVEKGVEKERRSTPGPFPAIGKRR